MNGNTEDIIKTRSRQAPAGEERIAQLQALCGGKLFLSLCIAHTCGTLFALFMLPYALLSVLVSVGLWLIYGFSRKNVLSKKAFTFKFLSVPMMIFEIITTIFLITLIVCLIMGAIACIFSTHELVIDAITELLASLQGVPEWIPQAVDGFTWSGIWALVYLIAFSLIVYLPLQIACLFFKRGRRLFSSVHTFVTEKGFADEKKEKCCRKQLKRFTASLVALGIVCCFINLPMAVALFIAHAFAEQAQSI